MSGKPGRKLVRVGTQVRFAVTPTVLGVGVVRELDKKTPGWRVLVFTGKRVDGSDVLEWMPHTSVKPTGKRTSKAGRGANHPTVPSRARRPVHRFYRSRSTLDGRRLPWEFLGVLDTWHAVVVADGSWLIYRNGQYVHTAVDQLAADRWLTDDVTARKR